jgi:hypothetical protein
MKKTVRVHEHDCLSFVVCPYLSMQNTTAQLLVSSNQPRAAITQLTIRALTTPSGGPYKQGPTAHSLSFSCSQQDNEQHCACDQEHTPFPLIRNGIRIQLTSVSLLMSRRTLKHRSLLLSSKD